MLLVQVTVLRQNSSALGHEVAEMQQQSVANHQVIADRDYLNKKLERLREQLSQARTDKDRLWEQAREDKALMAKALQELQKQLEMFKTEKEEALSNWTSDNTFLTNENANLKKRIAEFQGGAVNDHDSADFEMAQLRMDMEHASNQRDQIEQKLQRVLANQDEGGQEEAAKERAQLTSEVTHLRDEVERLKMNKDTSTDVESEDLRTELAVLQTELERMRKRASSSSEVQSLRHENEMLQLQLAKASQSGSGDAAMLGQVLLERDAALGELNALTNQVESLRSRGSLEQGGPKQSAEIAELRRECDSLALSVKQARAERDVLTKYVIKLEADLEGNSRRRR